MHLCIENYNIFFSWGLNGLLVFSQDFLEKNLLESSFVFISQLYAILNIIYIYLKQLYDVFPQYRKYKN